MGHSIRKTYYVDAAHRLYGHTGKCRNLHGHRYAIDLEFTSVDNELNHESMVIDFGELKEIREWLDREWDHNVLLNVEDPLAPLYMEVAGEEHLKMPFTFYGNPTAENMAETLVGVIDSNFPIPGATLVSVKVWETPTSVARYDCPEED